MVQPLWKTVCRLLKKLKIDLPNDPAISLLGMYLKETKTLIRKDTCTLLFIAALFTTAKIWKQPKCPSTDEWIKMWCIYTHTHTHTHAHTHTHTMEYYSDMKKNEILPFAATWMDSEGILLSEISQTEKDKYSMLSFICGI